MGERSWELSSEDAIYPARVGGDLVGTKMPPGCCAATCPAGFVQPRFGEGFSACFRLATRFGDLSLQQLILNKIFFILFFT